MCSVWYEINFGNLKAKTIDKRMTFDIFSKFF